MEYYGESRVARVRITDRATGTWANYRGQECEAIFYGEAAMPQINSEQLSPPLPKWQSVKRDWIEEVQLPKGV